MKVLNLIRLFWGWVFPYISLTYSLYRWVPPFQVPEMFGEIMGWTTLDTSGKIHRMRIPAQVGRKLNPRIVFHNPSPTIQNSERGHHLIVSKGIIISKESTCLNPPSLQRSPALCATRAVFKFHQPRSDFSIIFLHPKTIWSKKSNS